MRIYWFTVTGKGDFPFRCLVHSRAWPDCDYAAHQIALSCPTIAPEQTITLLTQKPLDKKDSELWQAEKWPITGGGSIS